MGLAPTKEQPPGCSPPCALAGRYQLVVLHELPPWVVQAVARAVGRLGSRRGRVGRGYAFPLRVKRGGDCERVWVKVFGFRNAWDWWRTPWVLSKAERAARAAELVAYAGVPTPQPLICFVPRDGRRPSILVTRHFPHDETLRAFLPKIRGSALEKHVASRVGAMARALHEAGVVHNDLNDANVVVRRTEAGVALGVLDLGRARFMRPTCWRGLADLARLRFRGRARRALVEGYTGSCRVRWKAAYLAMESYSRMVFFLKALRHG